MSIKPLSIDLRTSYSNYPLRMHSSYKEESPINENAPLLKNATSSCPVLETQSRPSPVHTVALTNLKRKTYQPFYHRPELKFSVIPLSILKNVYLFLNDEEAFGMVSTSKKIAHHFIVDSDLRTQFSFTFLLKLFLDAKTNHKIDYLRAADNLTEIRVIPPPSFLRNTPTAAFIGRIIPYPALNPRNKFRSLNKKTLALIVCFLKPHNQKPLDVAFFKLTSHYNNLHVPLQPHKFNKTSNLKTNLVNLRLGRLTTNTQYPSLDKRNKFKSLDQKTLNTILSFCEKPRDVSALKITLVGAHPRNNKALTKKRGLFHCCKIS